VLNLPTHFIAMSLSIFYYCIVFISFLSSLTIYFTSFNQNKYLKLFPPFLLATLLAELLGLYLQTKRQNNVTLFNFFTAFEFCFYLWIISLIISDHKIKKIIKATTVIYAIASLTNILFIQKIKTFHTITYSLGCLLIVSFCIYYFLELFRLPKSVKLKNDPAFWLCSGLLFYYCCGFPLLGLVNFVNAFPKLVLKNFRTILTILNIFLYSLFTIAFLCRIKTRKYTLSLL
jgi:hypothetical protein